MVMYSGAAGDSAPGGGALLVVAPSAVGGTNIMASSFELRLDDLRIINSWVVGRCWVEETTLWPSNHELVVPTHLLSSSWPHSVPPLLLLTNGACACTFRQ